MKKAAVKSGNDKDGEDEAKSHDTDESNGQSGRRSPDDDEPLLDASTNSAAAGSVQRSGGGGGGGIAETEDIMQTKKRFASRAHRSGIASAMTSNHGRTGTGTGTGGGVGYSHGVPALAAAAAAAASSSLSSSSAAGTTTGLLAEKARYKQHRFAKTSSSMSESNDSLRSSHRQSPPSSAHASVASAAGRSKNDGKRRKKIPVVDTGPQELPDEEADIPDRSNAVDKSAEKLKRAGDSPSVGSGGVGSDGGGGGSSSHGGFDASVNSGYLYMTGVIQETNIQPGAVHVGGDGNAGAQSMYSLFSSEQQSQKTVIETSDRNSAPITAHLVTDTVADVEQQVQRRLEEEAEARAQEILAAALQTVQTNVVVEQVADVGVDGSGSGNGNGKKKKRKKAFGWLILIIAVVILIFAILVGTLVGVLVGGRSNRGGPAPPPSAPSPDMGTNSLDFLQLVNLLKEDSSDGGEALDDPTSVQYNAALWLADDPNLRKFTRTRTMQRFALATLYLSTGGENWTVADRWLSNETECSWFTTLSDQAGPCDQFDQLTNLEIQQNNLNGTIPQEISILTNLKRLDLRFNSLSSAIPTSVGGLTMLTRLQVSFNELTGFLPSEVGKLTRIALLAVDHNMLSGVLPTELGDLVNLEVLGLEENHFWGRISGAFFDRFRGPEKFSFSRNDFIGPIPDEICAYEGIVVTADCEENVCRCCAFCCTDGIPPPCAEVVPGTEAPATTEQERFAILFAIISIILPDGGLSLLDPQAPQGAAIAWLARETEAHTYSTMKIIQRFGLATLYFFTNGDEWRNNEGWLTETSECSWHTSLGGTDLPCNNGGAYINLDLASNNLRGNLPAEVAVLSDLERLDVQDNHISGAIPSQIGELTALTQLQIEKNDFDEELPKEICDVGSLEGLTADCQEVECSCCTGCCNDYNNGECSPPEIAEELIAFFSGLSSDGGAALSNTSSPQFAAVQWLASEPQAALYSDRRRVQRYVLAVLYFGTNGNEWTINDRWLSKESECTWFSNSDAPCEGDGVFTDLDIQNNGLRGTLPSELSLLSDLEIMDLRENDLSGSIPTDIGALTTLGRFQMRHNGLTGTLPTEIGKMSTLRIIGVNNNTLFGTLPTELRNLADMVTFGFEINQFTGTVPVYDRCTNLNGFLIGRNDLTGAIPPVLCTFGAENFVADCDEIECPCCSECCNDEDTLTNPLECVPTTSTPPLPVPTASPTVGPLPDLINFLSALSTDGGIALSDPQSPQFAAAQWLAREPSLSFYSDTQKVQRYALATVYFSTKGDQWTVKDGWLSGQNECSWFYTDDPCDDGVFTEIDIKNNGLRGTLPRELSLLSDLDNLDLRENELSGTIPTEIGSLTKLERFQVKFNDLTGTLPTEMGRLPLLRVLGVDRNRIGGTLPTELRNLVSMVVFGIEVNQFTGTIPVYDLYANLRSFMVAKNNLVGSIPQEICDFGPTRMFADCEEIQCACCTECCSDELTSIDPLVCVPATSSPSFSPNAKSSPSPAPTDPVNISPGISNRPTMAVNPLPQLIMLFAGMASDRGASFADTDSPQFAAVQWLASEPNVLSYSDTKKIQRYALATFYYSTNGDQWTTNDGWLTEQNECTWFSTNDPCTSGIFTDLDIRNNGLSGTLPRELSLLSDLDVLDLRENNLFGTIPIEIGTLTKLLRFQVKHNALSGTLPTELGNLAVLKVIGVGDNRLGGTLPTELRNLSEMVTFGIEVNEFNGTVPAYNLFTNLVGFYIAKNNLVGTVPEVLCSFEATHFWADCDEIECSCCTQCCFDTIDVVEPLECVSVTNNPSPEPTVRPRGTSPLPRLIAILSGVSSDGGDALEDPNSSQYAALQWLAEEPGVMSYSEARVVQRYAMATLYFSTNGDDWTINTGWLSTQDECSWYSSEEDPCNDGVIIKLDIRNNRLRGTLPRELSLLSDLDILDLRENFLSSGIPTEIGALTKLVRFQVKFNDLTGTLPTELGRLEVLRVLGVDRNRIGGTLPTELRNLREMVTFGLVVNQFVGKVPAYDTFTNLKGFYIAKNNLTGTIPNVLCSFGARNFLADCAEIECSCCTECCYDWNPAINPLQCVPASSARSIVTSAVP